MILKREREGSAGKYRSLALVFTVVLCFMAGCSAVSMSDDASADGIHCDYDEETQTLTITGEGDIPDYTSETQP